MPFSWKKLQIVYIAKSSMRKGQVKRKTRRISHQNQFSVKSVNHHSVIRVSRRFTKRIHIPVRGKGTHSNQAPRRKQNSTTSTLLSLGYVEHRISELWAETSETSKHIILMKLDRFWNFMSAILDPVYGILKIHFDIRNQRPRKPPSTELCENRRVSKISCTLYLIRHFQK